MRAADRDRLLSQQAEIVDAARKAIASGGVSPVSRLTRRRRWTLLTLHATADRAIVLAARRGKRVGLTVEAYRFRRQGDAWVWEEVAPSVEYDEPRLPTRPRGTSGVFTTASTDGVVGLWHLVGEATWVRTDGQSQPVPDHGWVINVAGRGGATEVLDADGVVLGLLEEGGRLLTIPRPVRLVMSWHDRRRAYEKRWFNHSPAEEPEDTI